MAATRAGAVKSFVPPRRLSSRGPTSVCPYRGQANRQGADMRTWRRRARAGRQGRHRRRTCSPFIEPLELRRLPAATTAAAAAAVGPDGYGYVADPHPLENLQLSEGGAGVIT